MAAADLSSHVATETVAPGLVVLQVIVLEIRNGNQERYQIVLTIYHYLYSSSYWNDKMMSAH